MNKARYRAVYVCNSCSTRIPYYTVMHSHGVCPYCGHNADSTVMDVRVETEMYIPTSQSLWDRIKEIFE